VNPRAGLDNLEERKFFTLAGLEFRALGLQARSQSLYRMRYPGSSNCNKCTEFKNILPSLAATA
jgi:hypothetical protein